MYFSDVRAVEVRCTDELLIVRFEDGRSISVPLEWFPRLRDGTPEQRNEWRLVGGGIGIHWPQLDEDISAVRLIAPDAHPVRI